MITKAPKKWRTINKPIILIVDDQIQNLELLEAYLLPLGYVILKAENGKDALLILAENQIDLILLDIMMPGMNGFEVTRQIKLSPIHRQIPIILVTVLRETQDRVKGIEAGCDDFISKPIDKSELLARVRSLLKVKAYNDLMLNYRKELESEITSSSDELNLNFENLKIASLDTIYRLSMVAEYKDLSTGNHIKRMSRYSAAIARRMGLDESLVETILYAAPMHDLGKIGIPDGILMKPTRLDPVEIEIMRQHTLIGAIILEHSDSEFIRLAETIAECHHEWWDGSGYPNGLKGTEIPIAGRIVAVADVFDALTSQRPYQEPYSIEKSLAIVKKGSGNHFDPEVIDAFFAVQDEVLSIKKLFDDADHTTIINPKLKALLELYHDKTKLVNLNGEVRGPSVRDFDQARR